MSSRSVRFAGFVRPGDVPDDDDDRGDRRRQNRRHDDHQDRDRDRDRRRDQEEVDIDRPLSARELEDMFFGPKQHFKRTPDEYGEFPDFHDKYQQAQRIKAQRLAASSGGSGRAQAAAPENSPFDVPAEYDQRYRLNFAVFGTPLPSHMKHHEAQVKEYRLGVQCFEDFLQRKRFGQLQKSIKDRENLPIFAYKEEIVKSVRDNTVTIIAGDTGCGKSTQVPQYLMEAGFRKIACTQPRRIACHALARRVSHESLNVYGTKIAYQVRFDGTSARDTRILFLTEGLLLRILYGDPLLLRFDVIIIDEVHERHITGDFLMAILKSVLVKRPSIKLVLMSATINAEMFSLYFNNATIIQVPGRMYPVAVEYVPIEEDPDLINEKHFAERQKTGMNTSVVAKPVKLNSEPYLKILERIDQEYPKSERGDMLVFLSGIHEISYLAEELRPYASYTKKWIILMLHSSLSVEEQDKVFDIAPDGVRKCILSTNIAETSVTIDGIRFIIDSGKVKEMGVDEQVNMMKLQEFWISKASAQQRAGRAGRTGPGKCFRIFSRNEFDHLNPYAVPEIMRIPLHSLILQIKGLNLGDPRSFDLVQKPPQESLDTYISFLKVHGALTDDERITPMGYTISLLPIDFILAKMLLLGIVFDIVDPVLTLAAALSVQSPFVRLTDENVDIMKNRRIFDSEHGDGFTLLNMVDAWLGVKARRENSKLWCKKHGLEEQHLYDIIKLKKQFESDLYSNRFVTEHDNATFFEKRRRRDNRRSSSSSSSAAAVLSKRDQRDLMQQARIAQSSRKRKVLRMEDGVEAELEEPDEAGNGSTKPTDGAKVDLTTVDIRDLDFHLTHDIEELESNAKDTKQFSMWEINLLKIILCSGLYPNIAIADDGNLNRKDSDLVFHTVKTRFVMLHPTSVFNANPEHVAPRRISDERRVAEVLCYQQLLETNKTYVMSLQRLPALATFLLFARKIETDDSGTRLIIDDWIEVRLSDGRVAGEHLVISHRFRRLWQHLLHRRLTQASKSVLSMSYQKDADASFADLSLAFAPGVVEGATVPLPDFLPSWVIQIRKDIKAPQDLTAEELSRKMCEFFESKVNYRLEVLRLEESSTVYKPDNVGLQVTSYLRYGSVKSVSEATDQRAKGFSDHMLKWFKCPTCAKEMMVDRPKLLLHLETCQQVQQQQQQQASSSSLPSSSKGALRSFYCTDCKQTLQLSPMDILRHRRGHEDAL